MSDFRIEHCYHIEYVRDSESFIVRFSRRFFLVQPEGHALATSDMFPIYVFDFNSDKLNYHGTLADLTVAEQALFARLVENDAQILRDDAALMLQEFRADRYEPNAEITEIFFNDFEIEDPPFF